MTRRRLALMIVDLAMTAVAVATIRELWDTIEARTALAFLIARALIPSEGKVGRFCRSLAATFVLAYLFRRGAAIDVVDSEWWIGAITATLVILLEGAHARSVMGLSGLLVAIAILFMLPTSDTSLVHHSLGLWSFAVIVVSTVFVVASALSLLDRSNFAAFVYVASPALIFVPLALLSPLLLSKGLPPGGLNAFWVRSFVFPGMIGAILAMIPHAIAGRHSRAVQSTGSVDHDT